MLWLKSEFEYVGDCNQVFENPSISNSEILVPIFEKFLFYKNLNFGKFLFQEISKSIFL